jgi:DsbC/DsbD-like thiol-disulfide interchange protein
MLRLVLLALLALPPSIGSANAASEARVDGAAVALIATRTDTGGLDLAIAVDLDPGYKTYWRQPGDSGVPPFFDWSRSRNLTVEGVDHPYPIRFSDGYGTSLGHEGTVLLPVRAAPADPKAPLEIAVTIDLGVCREMCVPVRVSLSMALKPADHDAAAAREIAAARAALPTKVAGAAAIAAHPTDSRRVVITVPGAREAVVDGPADWALPIPVPMEDAPAGSFVMELDGMPKTATVSGTPVAITYLSADGPRETRAVLP